MKGLLVTAYFIKIHTIGAHLLCIWLNAKTREVMHKLWTKKVKVVPGTSIIGPRSPELDSLLLSANGTPDLTETVSHKRESDVAVNAENT